MSGWESPPLAMKRNYFYNLIFSFSNILFPIITFPYVSRILGPSGIGKVQFVTSFSQYFTLIAALGIPVYGIQVIAGAKGDFFKLSKVFSELTSIYIITSLLLSLAYFALIFSVPFFGNQFQLFLFAGLIVVLSFTSIEWFYSGLEDFKTIAVRSVVIKSIALVLTFTFIKEADDYLAYLLIVLFTIQGSHFLNVVLLRGKVSLSFSGLNLKRHLKPLLFIFSTTVAASMYTVLDTVILGFLTSDESVGLYTAAVKLTRITIPIVISLGAILVPQVARALARNEQEDMKVMVNKAFGFVLLLAIPISVGLLLLAPEFIEVFSGEGFLLAVPSMQILSILPLLVGLGHLFAFVILVPAGFHKEVFYSVALGLGLCLALNFVLIPAFLEVGASIANVLTEVVVTCSYLYFIQRNFRLSFNWMPSLKSILCASLFVPIIFGLRLLSLSAALTLTLSIGSCVLVYMTLQMLVLKNVLMMDLWQAVMKKLNL
ncbi:MULTISPECIES: flippase [unclassified Imperialibacter]|uniref:flippase n=1 Tax=unclassified Imperialibacter TaxID=2629706 RepID=UPI001252A9CF|nr:conserved membrane hypothetical protein [Imperialibacter sp. 89]CAD5296447.1 conserved membrane hypothetical protein [Imperialibacter sp. 75]VVT33800.1 conserved membrane hypothetical protein [Imperialibacter sp. EC-SDR9]